MSGHSSFEGDTESLQFRILTSSQALSMYSTDKTRRKTRVAHLTSVHSPTDVRIYDKECCSLFEEGYDTVVVGPGESRDDGCRPRVSGVVISRSRAERLLRTIPSVLRHALEVDAEIFHLHDPELIPVGLVLKAMGKKVIFDSHEDIVVDILEKTYLPPAARHLCSGIGRALLFLADNCFDAIVAATGDIANNFTNRNTTTINNFPEWRACELEQFIGVDFANRRPIVAYVGGISADRGIIEMVQALELVARTTPVTLVLAGPFQSPELEKEVRGLFGWRFVDYRGKLARSKVLELLAEAVCGLLVLHPTGNYLRSNPIKLYEYLALGLPVIMSDFPAWRELFSTLNIGVFVNPHDPRQIAESIGWILANRRHAAHMGERGRHAVGEQFNWTSERTKLLGLYRNLLGSIVDPGSSEKALRRSECGHILGERQ
jgi:glycosyltransferase involved in cell wall biosynthesis